ncbi:MAG: bifunctional methylenetetrahydrofolate dehydrogenase/methenyltetrahydrofolate cyclohydrolase FolD [Planctomycetota bacterium]
MTAREIDGRSIAHECRSALKQRVEEFTARRGYAPGLGVILVGNDAASMAYVRNKEHACEEIGIRSFHHGLPANANRAQLEALIDQLNVDRHVHGILLQLPLPKHIPGDEMLRRILPEKDVDGFHPMNAGLLAVGTPEYVPCTPKGVMRLLKTIGVPLAGMNAVVVGRSNIVGKPIAQLLLLADATVTICHRQTRDLAGEIARADLVVAAIGRPRAIKGEWIKPGAVVIDVGINRMPGVKGLIGDVDYAPAAERASWITPVPGGVGPMTVAMLLENTVEGALRYDR